MFLFLSNFGNISSTYSVFARVFVFSDYVIFLVCRNIVNFRLLPISDSSLVCESLCSMGCFNNTWLMFTVRLLPVSNSFHVRIVGNICMCCWQQVCGSCLSCGPCLGCVFCKF
jgi:uncharacterized membrane protein YdjX (TVP38/TMEM64 family)